MRRLSILLVPITLAVAVPAISWGSASHAVRLQNTAIHPARISVRRGDRVTWRFLDGAYNEAHTVTSYAGRRFRSIARPQKTGTYSVRFTRSGTYLYHCAIHPNMEGRVIVR